MRRGNAPRSGQTVPYHQRAWKHFGVRPATGSPGPEKTDDRYCKWDRLHRGHGYTASWVEKLADALSTTETYKEVMGQPPPIDK